ncbi:biotin--[acetyl-CoA-carboxylase] ligase [Roseiconus nitratireducens]|uniref:biotin--[acetyl-CoA-carboxylase] ligase n=1 Tax=Roseiconus nitratireducens TaxID=2605748 RepID=UPI001376391C|nr:biotin--[acetyl-CoA-carboxylase] ligase [Roseiconus nitratireducens]
MDTVLECIGSVCPATRSVVRQSIDTGLIGSARYSDQTESTNRDAIAELQHPLSPPILPRLHLTDHQTAGRGRLGNRWQSAPMALTLTLTTKVDPANPASGILSLAVGVAVARAIEFVCAPCRIALKWPNDLCSGWLVDPAGRERHFQKLGGILIESTAPRRDVAVIGIGLNLEHVPSLRDGSATPPGSLSGLTGRPVHRPELLAAVLESLSQAVEELFDDPGPLMTEYRSRCLLIGSTVTLRQNATVVQGRCTGISDDGALEILCDGRRRTFRSGEVSQVRPG